MSINDIELAIAYIEECRQTHVLWADYQERVPNWRDYSTPDDPGDRNHHLKWVDKYDHVLAVLRELT